MHAENVIYRGKNRFEHSPRSRSHTSNGVSSLWHTVKAVEALSQPHKQKT